MLDEFKRETDLTERKMLHCVMCKRQTIHLLEARCTGTWDDREHINGGGSYSTYRCGACDAVCFEATNWCSEDYDYDENGDVYHPDNAVQYPAPVSAHFNFNTESTPGKLNTILEEMLYALAGSKMILATVGLRLAVEFIVNDKRCAGRNLEKKIDDLRAKGTIDDDQTELLHRIRKRGNDGAHEAKGMTANELVAGMSIVEGLLEKLYNGPARHDATIKRAKRLLRERNANDDVDTMDMI